MLTPTDLIEEVPEADRQAAIVAYGAVYDQVWSKTVQFPVRVPLTTVALTDLQLPILIEVIRQIHGITAKVVGQYLVIGTFPD